MQPRTDHDLLADYAKQGSESAFAELVHRHAAVVYSAALRQVGEPERARDVAQSVFADLARKARSLRGETVLVGWLYRSTRYAALKELRDSRRRTQRERQAMSDLHATAETPAEWEQIHPHLDEAIASLPNEDRNAVLLRFFKNDSFASIGTTLGVSEDAAQKRVSRALEKLKTLLAAQGVKTSVATLTVLLSANAVQSVPAVLAGSLSAGALASAASATGFALANMFTLPKLAAALGIAMVATIASLGTLHVRSRDSLVQANQEAKKQSNDLRQLRAENQRLKGLANAGADVERLRREAADVLRLRGEATVMRMELEALKTRAGAAAPSINQDAGVIITDTTRTETRIMVSAKIAEIDTAEWQQRILPRVTFSQIFSGSEGLLTSKEYKALLQQMEQTGNTDIVSPTVLALNGQQAQIAISPLRALVDPGTGSITNVSKGPVLSVTPYGSTNSPNIDLDVEVRVNEVTGDPGTIQTITAFKSTSSRTLVPSGQTLILIQAIELGQTAARGQGPRTRIVFLTPSLFDPKDLPAVQAGNGP